MLVEGIDDFSEKNCYLYNCKGYGVKNSVRKELQ